MKKFYMKSEQIFLEDEIFSGYLEIENGFITAISTKVEADAEILDYSQKIIAPGYFDTHIHGFAGHDVMDATAEAITTISEAIVATGVTSFLPTTLTDTVEKLKKACANIAENKNLCKGAKIQGIFLEGPFFTEEHKGAQNPAYMSDPDINKLMQWKNASQGLVNKIAIAPERNNSLNFIKEAKAEGVYVALGHSNATYQEAEVALETGATIFIHTYNGMSPLHHRNPGMVGAALTSENAYLEVICDGQHVHPAAIQALLKARTTDKVVLITDCMMAGGMDEGEYKLGDFDVIVKDGAVKLKSGSLAGSVLTLDKAVKNVVEWGLASPLEAVKMASLIPARSVNLEQKIGSIQVGKYADINILNSDLSVEQVYINGERKY